MAMGTSQMLTCMEERIHALDKEAEIICYGQEINPFTFGIAKADMLIRGGDPENMQFGDTLNADKFKGYTFDYIISNPPLVSIGSVKQLMWRKNINWAMPVGLALAYLKIRWADAVLAEWHC